MKISEKLKKLFSCSPKTFKSLLKQKDAAQSVDGEVDVGEPKQPEQKDIITPVKVTGKRLQEDNLDDFQTPIDNSYSDYTSEGNRPSPSGSEGSTSFDSPELSSLAVGNTNESFKATSYSIDIFHDAENCPVRSATNGSRLYDLVVRSILGAVGVDVEGLDVDVACTVHWRFVLPFLHNRHFPNRTLRDLLTRGVTHINPGDKLGAVDVVVKEAMDRLRTEHQGDALARKQRRIVVIISGDRDFAANVRSMKQAGFNCVLIYTPHKTCPSFVDLFRPGYALGIWEDLVAAADCTRAELEVFEKRLSFMMSNRGMAGTGGGGGKDKGKTERIPSSHLIKSDCLDHLLRIGEACAAAKNTATGAGSDNNEARKPAGVEGGVVVNVPVLSGQAGRPGMVVDDSLGNVDEIYVHTPGFRHQCTADLYEFLLMRKDQRIRSDEMALFYHLYPQHRQATAY
jgi:hypothetical protein